MQLKCLNLSIRNISTILAKNICGYVGLLFKIMRPCYKGMFPIRDYRRCWRLEGYQMLLSSTVDFIGTVGPEHATRKTGHTHATRQLTIHTPTQTEYRT